MTHHVDVPRERIATFCQQQGIRRLAFFGSVIREDFAPDSDIDVLVEFEAGRTPGLIRLAGMEMELSAILGGRKVDLNTPKSLSRYFRDQAVAESQVQYGPP